MDNIEKNKLESQNIELREEIVKLKEENIKLKEDNDEMKKIYKDGVYLNIQLKNQKPGYVVCPMCLQNKLPCFHIECKNSCSHCYKNRAPKSVYDSHNTESCKQTFTICRRCRGRDHTEEECQAQECIHCNVKAANHKPEECRKNPINIKKDEENNNEIENTNNKGKGKGKNKGKNKSKNNVNNNE
jgi:hypothetical protein